MVHNRKLHDLQKSHFVELIISEKYMREVYVTNKNANAFSLNAIVDVRRLRHHEMIFLISRKVAQQAASSFATTKSSMAFRL